jgi:cytosine deaminase
MGLLLSPPFVDAHFHMDATLSYGLPRVNASGTLLEGIALWGELKPLLTAQALIDRALAYCDWAVAKGLLAIRSHVDICDPRLLAVQALLDVKRRVASYLDLQLVAFPQDGVLRSPGAFEQLKRALAMGVDVVGGIPHFERTMQQGAESVRLLCELAAAQGRMVDMHCDESDDPLSRHVETLAFETQRLGLHGRVTGSHLTSMHSMDNYYVSKLLPLMVQAQLNVVSNPLINITLQGRHDTYPKRRGMTRVPELLALGLNVAFGHDCVMDPWYSLGSADMLEVAQMGLHVAQMTGQAAMRQCFDAVTCAPARILGLDGYGIEPGCHADFVLLQARDPVEAIRLRATRLAVYRRGQRIAGTPANSATLSLPGRPAQTQFMIDRPG